ncbi:MAG: hypothetical protein JWM64_1061 [Frankiales bacterium]|nr:hypothetical protein [Frankiales bacterium]
MPLGALVPAALRVRSLLTLLVLLLGTATPLALAVDHRPAAAAPIATASKYVPLQPTRALDTRDGTGAPHAAVPAGGTVELTVAGRSGVPASGASAVVLNVTIAEAKGTGHVSVYPSGTDGRGTSVIGHTSSTRVIAGLVTAPIGANGRVTLYTSGGGHLIADVLGYYQASGASTDGRFAALAPNRLLDTRTDGPRPAAGTSRLLQITGRGGVPTSGVSAVALNVTATAVDRAGFVQVVPTGSSTPIGGSSNIGTSSPGQTIANLVIVPVGADGQVRLYTSQAAHLIADVTGYYTDGTAPSSTGGLFQAVEPARELDTRERSAYFGTTGTRPASGTELRIDMTNRRSVPASGVSAVALGVAAVAPQGAGFAQVSPTGGAPPASASTLGYAGGQVIANAALAPLGAGGSVSVYVSTGTHLIADVFGYFLADGAPVTAASPSGPASPTPTGTPSGPAALAGLVVAPANTSVPYSRDEWRHWIDADGDCQDTRAEVLLVESLAPVTFTTASNCTVATGRWHDPYSGQDWTLAGDVDIDHFVPLGNAHRSGGYAWNQARKQAYANDLADPEHLIAVEDNLNQSKSDSGPEQWKPPLRSYWCTYATDWAGVKKRWTLTVTQPEWDALADMLATCGSTPAPATAASPSPSPSPSASPAPSPTPSPTLCATPAPTGAQPANPGDTKNCTDFATWRSAQDWFDRYYPYYGDVARLDSDGDRIACEDLPGAP